MSATVSEVQASIIRDSLRLKDTTSSVIRRNLNRSNICYVAQPLVGSAKFMPNYNFLVPEPNCELESTIVFCDDRKLTITIANYLRSRLSPALPAKNYILPYHSCLSDETRQENWQAYMSGRCRILVSTSSAGTVGSNSILMRTFVI
jgi:superfamily II DNA helicase RecQ